MDFDMAQAAEQIRAAAQQHQLRLSVIVPVFNNGEHLRTAAFPSLLASPHFAQLQVLLVDDGSTYRHTREAVRELAAGHRNVEAFFLPEGGSGSASRPRNVGLQLCATEFVTYLDPDDEAHDEGYWRLQQLLESTPAAQFALGDQITVTDAGRELTAQHARYAPLAGDDGLYRVPADALARVGFRPSSLEGMVLRTQWLRAQQIEQVEGAAGQDSLFFLQVLHAAEAFVVLEQPVYIYHANVAGSMVNAITTEYFARCLLRERAQVAWLTEAGLLEDFVRTRFEHFFVTWYLEKFELVPWPQREESAALLHQIAELYIGDPREHRWRYPQSMRFFGRYSVPSLQGLRPWAGAAKRGSARAVKHLAKNVRTRRARGR